MTAFVILQFYNGAYKRLGHEALKAPLLDPESGFNSAVVNPAHPEDSKHAASLVRVTSMDSGGSNSNNGSSHLANADLSVANSSINMWNVSILLSNFV